MGGAPVHVPSTPPRHLPGEEGTWVVIFGDMSIFALLFGVYLKSRGEDAAVFTASQAQLNQAFGFANTLILLFSSYLVVKAVRGFRAGDTSSSSRRLLAAAGCGVVFVVLKVIEYSQKASDGLGPSTNSFYTYFYVLTAIHLIHVIVGIVLLFIAHRLCRRTIQNKRDQSYLEGIGCFWHMVDLLWIAIFPLLYLVR